MAFVSLSVGSVPKDADEGKAKVVSENAPSSQMVTEWSGSLGPNSGVPASIQYFAWEEQRTGTAKHAGLGPQR